MKKLYLGMTASMAIVALVGCSDSATPKDSTTVTSDLTLEQVYDKAMEQQQTIQSVKAHVDMDQTSTMMFEGEEVNMTNSSSMDIFMHVKPLAISMDGTTEMDMGGETMDIPIKMYMTEADGFYMQNGPSGEWMKIPAEMYEQMLAQTGGQADAAEQLEQLKQFINDFTFEQTDETYILTLNAEGEKFKDVILAQSTNVLGDMGEEVEGLFDGMSIEHANYVITINKDTFDMTEMMTDLQMNIDLNGEQSRVDTKSTTLYSDFNAVDTITIPTEVVESASDMF